MTLSPKLRRYKRQIHQEALRLERRPDDIANWLDQFASNELPFILPLLQNLHYISLTRERMLLARAARTLQQMGATQPKFCSIGPSYKSSSGKLRQFMKINGIPKEQVCIYEDILRLDPSSYGDIVFIDDIIGTGTQIRKFLNEVRDVIAGKTVFIVYICGSTSAAESLRADLGIKVLLLDEFPGDFTAFSDEVFPRELASSTARKICLAYGATLEPAMPLGYRDSELLVAFHDFCPNNTLPIFWSVNAGWCALFPTPQPSKISSALPTVGQIAAPTVRDGKGNESTVPEMVRSPEPGSGRRRDWGFSPPVETFFGRRRELETLTRWITTDRCRLVVVWGMAGVGKSSLTLRACRPLAGTGPDIPTEFDGVVWRRVVNPPAFEHFLLDILGSLSRTNLELGVGTEKELERRVVRELQESRCLIILDNFESVISSSEMSDLTRAEAVKYEAFIELLASLEHQSVVVLTSSEKPKFVQNLEGEKRAVRSMELTGLDASAARKLFGTIGRFRGEGKDWQELTTYYSGNPLMLEDVAREIVTVFNGDVREYLSSEFAVPNSLSSRVEHVFERLDRNEKLFLYWLALNREPVHLGALARDLVHRLLASEIYEILLGVRRKIRIEQVGDTFYLLPALLNCITGQLIRAMVGDIFTGEGTTIDDVAIVKASSKDYLRDAQRELVAVRILNGLSNKLGSKRSISLHLRAALRSFVQSGEHQGGYRIGNYLNLLAVLEGELSDLDVSGTVVREAYLRGMPVRDVDFSGCEFSSVAFDEAIGGLVCGAYRPDGLQFATGDMNGALQLWNASSGKKIRTLEIHDGWIRCVAYSSDGRLIATAGEDSRVQLWELDHDENVARFHGDGGRALAVALASDPIRVAFGGDDNWVSIASVGTGARPLRLPAHGGRVWALAFSSCGTFLAVGCGTGNVNFWNLREPQPTRVSWSSLGQVRCLAFSPCDAVLGVGTEEGGVFLIDPSKPGVTHRLGSHSDAVRSIGFSNDSQHLATGDRNGAIAIWDWREAEKVRVFTRGRDCIRALSLHPDEASVLSVTDDGFCIWDWNSARATKSVTRALNSVWAVSASTEGPAIFAGYEDGSIMKWDLTTSSLIAESRLHTDRVRALDLSTSANILASGGSDRRIFLGRGDLAQNTFRKVGNEVPWIRAISLSVDGTMLACGGGADEVQIRDCRTLEVICSFATDGDVIQSLRFSTDGQSIIALANSGRVYRRSIPSGAITGSVSFKHGGLRALDLVHSDDSVVVGSNTGLIALCSLSRGMVDRSWEAHSAGVNALVTLGSGLTFASASNDGTVRLWNAEQEDPSRPLATYTFESVPTAMARVWPTGHLAVGCIDGRTRIWDPISGSCNLGVAPRAIYGGSNIFGVTGLTEDQKRSLRTLGAVG